MTPLKIITYNLMKNLIIISLITVKAVCLSAQVHHEAEITVNANVLGELSVLYTEDADFGNISALTPGEVFLDPKGNNSSYVGAAASPGKMAITGQGSQSVRIGWPASITLYGEEDDLTFTFALSGSGSDNQSGSIDLIADGGFVTVELIEGVFYLWIGGSLGKMESQAVGNYSGAAHFTIEYN